MPLYGGAEPPAPSMVRSSVEMLLRRVKSRRSEAPARGRNTICEHGAALEASGRLALTHEKLKQVC